MPDAPSAWNEWRLAIHVSSYPAGTDGIDRKVWQGGGELDGDAVQRCLGDAVGGRPPVGAVGQLSAAAGNIDDSRIVALSQKWQESLRDEERPERIGSQRLLKHFRGEREDILVFIEENPGIVYQRVETIALAGKFFRRALDAFRVGDVDLKEGNVSLIFFLLIELFCSCLAGLFVARTEGHPKTFAGELAHHFESNPLICAGHEGGSLFSSHFQNCDVCL